MATKRRGGGGGGIISRIRGAFGRKAKKPATRRGQTASTSFKSSRKGLGQAAGAMARMAGLRGPKAAAATKSMGVGAAG